jgi:hypothetical protein
MMTDVPIAILRETLDSSMGKLGWSLQRRYGLPAAYTRDERVCPYFYFAEFRHGPNVPYVVVGAIGVIDGGFEEHWVRERADRGKAAGFAALLHIANINELSRAAYVRSADDVRNFSAAVVNVLNSMPCDEQQLLAAFKANSLCGRRFDAFAGYSNRHKFQAFKEYLTTLARADQQPSD